MVLRCKVDSLLHYTFRPPLGIVLHISSCLGHSGGRIWKKLDLWKRQYLLKRGIQTFVKSIIFSLSIYFMSLFMIFPKVGFRLEKIQMDFPWRGWELRRKSHLIRWLVVVLKKEDRRLGIRILFVLNKAFLGKFCWRFAFKYESLWK